MTNIDVIIFWRGLRHFYVENRKNHEIIKIASSKNWNIKYFFLYFIIYLGTRLDIIIEHIYVYRKQKDLNTLCLRRRYL